MGGEMGTLNGSSPTANLAGANIKGNEAFLHFPRVVAQALRGVFFDYCYCGSRDECGGREGYDF